MLKTKDSEETVLEFMQTLWAVDHELQLASKRLRQRIGITGPQRLVIRFLGRSSSLSAGELSSLLRLHPSTLTGILGRLEKRKLIERTTDPDDRRRAVLSLTRAGSKYNREMPGSIEAAVELALSSIGKRQSSNVVSALRQLANSLALQAQTT